MKIAASTAGITLFAVVAGAIVLSPILGRQKPTFDLIIRNGSVIDGTGSKAKRADVAIRDGRIAAIGAFKGRGKKEIDATGMVVAPGFIDVHTHGENILEYPAAENYVRMGVTSIVVGNCGSSNLDVGAFYRSLGRVKPSINVGTLLGHGSLRRDAMGGEFNRPPNSSEMQVMKARLERALTDGALGLSTGLIYLPGTFAKTDEIVELAKIAARHDAVYASHMRNEGLDIFKAIDELGDVAIRSGVRTQLSHIKLSGESMWGKATEVLERLKELRRKGVELTHDQYMYTASATTLSVLVDDEFLEGGLAEFRRRLAEPETKERMISMIEARLQRRGRTDFGYAVLTECRTKPDLVGLNLVQAAKVLRGADALRDQIETILELVAPGGTRAVFHGIAPGDLKLFLKDPNTMIASDGACQGPGSNAAHPRSCGNNARALAQYVRTEEVLSLEEAIRKMTSMPARVFRIRGRGILAVGNLADVVIFDPAKVADRATFERPMAYSTGFRAVIVNGVIVAEHDRITGRRGGQVIRRARI